MTSNEVNVWISFHWFKQRIDLLMGDAGSGGGGGVELKSSENKFCRYKLKIVLTNAIQETSKVTLKTWVKNNDSNKITIWQDIKEELPSRSEKQFENFYSW